MRKLIRVEYVNFQQYIVKKLTNSDFPEVINLFVFRICLWLKDANCLIY